MSTPVSVYQMPYSPYCFPITESLRALGIRFKTINIKPHTREEIIRLTGGKYYQVPVLVDGSSIVYETGADSQIISRYIDRVFGKGRLFPKKHDGIQNILIRHIENDVEDAGFRLVDPFYIGSIKDPVARTLLIRHKERKFGKGCVSDWKRNRKKLLEKLENHFDDFENILRHSPYLLGDTPVYADFSFYGILGNYTYKGWNKIHPRYKAILGWKSRLEKFKYPKST